MKWAAVRALQILSAFSAAFVLSPTFAGLKTCGAQVPGAYAPGSMLTPAPQAKAENLRDNANLSRRKGSRLLTSFQRVIHSDKSRQRVGFHFFHHVAAMNFHCVFARTELNGYLFIEQARNY